MIAKLTVLDETARGECTNRVRIELASEKLTLQELITRRVHAEVKMFNLMRPVTFKALVQPADAEETPNGFRMRQHRDLDPDKIVERAVRAFEEKLFYVEVDHQVVKNLGDEFVITPTTSVSFVKLMPITGG